MNIIYKVYRRLKLILVVMSTVLLSKIFMMKKRGGPRNTGPWFSSDHFGSRSDKAYRTLEASDNASIRTNSSRFDMMEQGKEKTLLIL